MKSRFRDIALAGAALAIMAAGGCRNADSTGRTELIIGTYGENIYLYSFDGETLEFTPRGRVEAKDASYALEEGDRIYAVSECGDGSGAYSFIKGGDGSIERTADLRQTGNDPCFLMLTDGRDGRHMMTADYSGGSVSVFPIKDGVIQDRCTQLTFSGSGPVTDRQEGSHIHQLKAVPDMEGRILAADLGADVIRILDCSTSGNGFAISHIGDIPCPPGSGPRHMEFGRGENGLILYCITELSGEVLVYDAAAGFSLIQRIQADEVNAGGSADIHIHPSGRWLYTSHRLENDGISIFSISADGTLTKSGYAHTGKHPRNFMITSDGMFLLAACRDDRLIQTFRIGDDGSLIPTGAELHLASDMPSSITGASKQ